MRYYYASGLPYSDELYHHGILGQKWGVRRFQNKDGTRTPAGKKRYSSERFKAAAKKAGEAITKAGNVTVKAAAKATKKVGKAAITSFKKRHPSFMTDDELRQYKARLDLERSYRQAKRDLKNHPFRNLAIDAISNVVKNTSSNFGNQFGQKLGQGLAEKLLKSDQQKEVDSLRAEASRMREKANYAKAKRDYEREMSDDRKATERATDVLNRLSAEDNLKVTKEKLERERKEREQAERDRQEAQRRQEQDDYVRQYRERLARLREENDRETEERRRRIEQEESKRHFARATRGAKGRYSRRSSSSE